MSDHFDIPAIALDWHRAGTGAALATVVDTWGSAPRRTGSQLVIAGDGRIEGSVSGGCVEGAVLVEALEALEDGQHRVLEYGVSDDDAFAVGIDFRMKVDAFLRSAALDMLFSNLDTYSAFRINDNFISSCIFHCLGSKFH